MTEVTEVSSKRRQGISGSTLKMLAVATMLIDHIAAAVLVRMLRRGADYELYEIYYIMRQIGRTAFPIYCFMMVEGLERTHNKYKYLARMGIFAIISEIPFDLAFKSRVLEFGYQNVFFTLTIGLAAMIALENINNSSVCEANVKMQTGIRTILTVLTVAVGMAAASFLRTDYGAYGVACILVMYFLRKNRKVELIAGYLAFVLFLGEIAALPAFILLAFYRGKKGFSCKSFFYCFYPVHLLLLYLTCVLMGIAAYSAI